MARKAAGAGAAASGGSSTATAVQHPNPSSSSTTQSKLSDATVTRSSVMASSPSSSSSVPLAAGKERRQAAATTAARRRQLPDHPLPSQWNALKRLRVWYEGESWIGITEPWERLLIHALFLGLVALVYFTLFVLLPSQVRSGVRRAQFYVYGGGLASNSGDKGSHDLA